jgi:DNA-binding response OmpR family regulator
MSTPVLSRFMPQTRAWQRNEGEVHDDSCLVVEHKRFFASVKGKPLSLTKTEFRVLSLLASNIGQIVTKESLWAFAWRPGKPLSRKSIHVFVSRVRGKIAPFGLKIDSLVGVGYILSHGTCCSPNVATIGNGVSTETQ